MNLLWQNAYFKYKNNDHAVSVALAGFLFAVGMISFSAISEFSEFLQIDETTCARPGLCTLVLLVLME